MKASRYGGHVVRRGLVLGVLVALGVTVACVETPPPLSPGATEVVHELSAGPTRWASQGEERWIVRFRDDALNPRELALSLASHDGTVVRYIWDEGVVRGFSAVLPAGREAELRSHPKVAHVRQVTQFRPASSWGLPRVNQRDLSLPGTYAPTHTGSGVEVYVVDTGIRAAHQAFGGRALTGNGGLDLHRESTHAYYGEDCYGPATYDADSSWVWEFHGTHVAGMIGGGGVGVAPGVDKLVSVRVAAACGGISSDDMITAMKWVVANASLPAVVNLSLESDDPDEDVEDEIDAAIQAGIVVVAAAGNEASDACSYSPARMPDVITVAASDSTDSFAASYPNGPGGSNFGSCVDLLAPGVGVVSAAAHINEDTTCTSCTVSFSGTSMAAPHVSGIAALLLEEYPQLTPAQVKDTILARSTVGVLSGLPSGTPDRLAFTPRLLVGGIEGPDVVWDTASYEWDAEHEGGDFTYAFEWSRRWMMPGWTGPWHSVGTDDKLELEIGSGSTDFELRLQIWSGSQELTDFQYVTVLCEFECIESAPHPPG